MIITLESGEDLRGDLIQSAIARHDLIPIPVTLELNLKDSDKELSQKLECGKTLTADNIKFNVVKKTLLNSRLTQGDKAVNTLKIIAFIDSVHKVGFVRETSKSIIKENTTLSQIYRAAGATASITQGDFPVPSFCCLVGETPTFHIAKILQEESGVIRYKVATQKIEFKRLTDLVNKEKADATIPENSARDVDSGFLERHIVPSFFTIKDDGSIEKNIDNNKSHVMRFAPQKNTLKLKNMRTVLVLKKIANVGYIPSISAGDLVDVNEKEKYIVITAAHIYGSSNSEKSEGSAAQMRTKLWLGKITTK